MTKYFSVDISNDIHIINLFETLEQAREACLAGATDAHEFADDMDDYENYESNDLPYAVYGVVLGKAKCKKKTLTEEEKDERCSDFDYVLEKPEIVDYPKDDDWIKCSDRLPNEHEYVLAWIESRYKPEYKSVTITPFYDGEFEIQAACHFNVLYWQPLPPPPTE